MKPLFAFLAIIALLLTFNASRATTHNVAITDYMFTPNNFTAAVGDTVIWTMGQTSGIPHTTTSLTIPAGATAWDNAFSATPGQTFMYVITVAGTYNYQCNYHYAMGMTGSFTVTGTTTEVNQVAPENTSHLIIPNPFTGSMIINYDKAGAVVVYNLLGEIVASTGVQGANTQREVNISSLPAGMYVVLLVSDGVAVETRMVMKDN
jgi:plastocyanin